MINNIFKAISSFLGNVIHDERSKNHERWIWESNYCSEYFSHMNDYEKGIYCFPIRGIYHCEDWKNISLKICRGDWLSFVRDGDNAYDEFAIAVYCGRHMLGWVPKELAKKFAVKIDADRSEYDVQVLEKVHMNPCCPENLGIAKITGWYACIFVIAKEKPAAIAKYKKIADEAKYKKGQRVVVEGEEGSYEVIGPLRKEEGKEQEYRLEHRDVKENEILRVVDSLQGSKENRQITLNHKNEVKRFKCRKCNKTVDGESINSGGYCREHFECDPEYSPYSTLDQREPDDGDGGYGGNDKDFDDMMDNAGMPEHESMDDIDDY